MQLITSCSRSTDVPSSTVAAAGPVAAWEGSGQAPLFPDHTASSHSQLVSVYYTLQNPKPHSQEGLTGPGHLSSGPRGPSDMQKFWEQSRAPGHGRTWAVVLLYLSAMALILGSSSREGSSGLALETER